MRTADPHPWDRLISSFTLFGIVGATLLDAFRIRRQENARITPWLT